MQQAEIPSPALGMTPPNSGDMYTAIEWQPIAIELAGSEVKITVFRDLLTLEAAKEALQATREGRLGVRQYWPEIAPLSYILGLALFPFAPAERIVQGDQPKRGLATLAIRQGLFGIRLDKRFANIGTLWVRYRRENEAAFMILTKAIQQHLAARAGAPVQQQGMVGKASQEPANINCPQCGHSVRAEDKFCGECGARLRLICGNCGKQLKPGDAFCSNCGTRVP